MSTNEKWTDEFSESFSDEDFDVVAGILMSGAFCFAIMIAVLIVLFLLVGSL